MITSDTVVIKRVTPQNIGSSEADNYVASNQKISEWEMS